MVAKSVRQWLQTQPPELFRFLHGIEKEGLRTDEIGRISQTDHPRPLGSALTHPQITTDYSEALLEFITPVNDSPEETLRALEDLHRYTFHVNPQEEIWPASMPAILDGELSVRIAEYGSSHIGRLKHAYRHGLWHRYGRIMQTIAGVHFNYSVPPAFWPAWQAFKQNTDSACTFRSQGYFGLIRQFRRHSWLLLYLFGASPAVDRSFLRESSARMQAHGEHTLRMPTATSLRMSDMGYNNAAQQSLKVCFNSLPTYIRTLQTALHTPYPPYAAIGIKQGGHYQQLNANILQIENEYYSDIRPKRNAHSGEKPLAALQRDGVEYVEIRCLDLNPFLPLGVDADQIRFLNWFLFWCLVTDADPISDVECERVGFNQRLTVLYGRDTELRLVGRDSVRELRDWGLRILDDIEALVDAVQPADQAQVTAALVRYRSWLRDPEKTPSGRLCEALENGQREFRQVALEQARQHRQTLTAEAPDSALLARMQAVAEQSLADQAELEAESTGSFDDFVQRFMAQEPPPPTGN